MRIEDTGVGMILTQDVVDERGNLLLEKGISLTKVYISRLKRLGIRTITVTDPYAESLKEAKIISPELREELTQCFTELFRMKAADILNFKPPAAHLQKLNSVMDSVIDEADLHLDQVVNVQVRQPSEDETHHAVNVCLLSVITGLYLKFDRQVLRDLALGALLHDLGKSMLPPGDTDKAFLHTIYGRELLQRSNLSSVVARIASEHHEAYDGAGFPKGLTGRETHPLSRLVAITNYFDMALAKTTHNHTPRQDIIEEMLGGGNTLFDLNMLRAFLNTAAIFPVGSLVRLNTGSTAYVVRNKVHFPLRPVVQIIEDTGSIEIDLVIKPNITIVDFVTY
ncbi:MAG: HD domain-containing protein [Negativicutes bacterium]|nr:HD domain-containing protein [Negativicutes bacterium]